MSASRMRKATNEQHPGAGSPYRTAQAPVRRAAASVDRDERWPRPLRLILLVLAALLVWVTTIAWREHRLKAEIEAMPEAERQAVYSHTIDELRSVCSAQPALREHCREQARLILKFPECDADCFALADPFLDHARR
jgi:hypothetical protein